MSDARTTRMARTACVLGALALFATTARAHHSFAMYDQTKQETYTGKLIRFIPGANHAQLLFELDRKSVV